MFGRATITLGIGPHSSCVLYWLSLNLGQSEFHCRVFNSLIVYWFRITSATACVSWRCNHQRQSRPVEIQVGVFFLFILAVSLLAMQTLAWGSFLMMPLEGFATAADVTVDSCCLSGCAPVFDFFTMSLSLSSLCKHFCCVCYKLDTTACHNWVGDGKKLSI